MPRVIFRDNKQIEFLKEIKLLSGLDANKLSVLSGVSSRTFRDWLRGKYNISEKAFTALTNKFPVLVPKDIKIVNDYWYAIKSAREGGFKRMQLYGPVGTVEGRHRGGINSQRRRRENPEFYKLLGCNLRKVFKIYKPSVLFAEATGIILGDGCISDCRLRITVSGLVDRQYAEFVRGLFSNVFKEKPARMERENYHTIELTLSGVGLVEELIKWGFKVGNKVRQQVDFPSWIWTNKEFQKACVRGLMDTDGGCYFHKHKCNGLVYRNFGMSFANQSLPIVISVAKILAALGIRFSLTKGGTKIYIYSFEEIKKYFRLIGSNNPKNIKKFNVYLSETTHRVF